MKKRILSVMLALAMCTGLLTACGSEGSEEGKKDSDVVELSNVVLGSYFGAAGSYVKKSGRQI